MDGQRAIWLNVQKYWRYILQLCKAWASTLKYRSIKQKKRTGLLGVSKLSVGWELEAHRRVFLCSFLSQSDRQFQFLTCQKFSILEREFSHICGHSPPKFRSPVIGRLPGKDSFQIGRVQSLLAVPNAWGGVLFLQVRGFFFQYRETQPLFL